MSLLVGLAFALTAPAAPVAGPCDLMDASTASALVGEPIEAGRSTPPEPDDETGGTMTTCMYRASKSMLIVSVMTFDDAAAARKAMSEEAVAGRLDGEVIKLTEEPGLGDKAYWAYTARGSQYVVVKGAKVLAVALGGALPKPPASYQAALRAAATSASKKL